MQWISPYNIYVKLINALYIHESHLSEWKKICHAFKSNVGPSEFRFLFIFCLLLYILALRNCTFSYYLQFFALLFI